MVFLLGICPFTLAQITSGEYFYDADPGISNGTAFSIPSEQYVDGEFTFSTEGLATGKHVLGIRVKEDGVWSVTQTIEFYIEPETIDHTNIQLIAGEYFIDADPGVGNGIGFSVSAADALDQELDIDLSGIAPGKHTLSVRYQNSDKIWGPAESTEFVIEPEAGLESGFLIKLNYEVRNTNGMVKEGLVPIEDKPGSIDMDLDIDISGLTEGVYDFLVFAVNEQGLMSIYESGSFFVIDGNAPTAISLSNNAVDEKEVIGTLIGEFSTTDPDEGESHTYELVAGEGDTDNDAFQITNNQLVTKEVFDFAMKNSYSIRVRSTDLGELSVEKSFEITVNEVKDAQTITFTELAIDQYGESQELNASASSGLTVTYQSSNSSVALIEDNQLTLVGLGEVTITALQAGNDSFEATERSQDITVGKAALVITANDATRVYGETNPEFTLSYQGFVLNETVDDITPPVISTQASQGSVVGTYDLLPSGGAADNYELNLQSGTLTINKADLTIAADDKERIYGEENPVLTASYTGFVLNETSSDLSAAPVLSTSADIGSDAGEYDITLSGGTATNYNLSLSNGTLVIIKAALTGTAEDKTRNKGEANPPFTIAYTGFRNSDDTNDLDTPPTASTTATTMSDRGTYDIVLSGGSDNNYDFALVSGTLRVTGPVIDLPAALNFGEVNVDESSEQELVFENTGDGALVITDIQSPAGFSVEPTNQTVAAGVVGNFVIRFTPMEARAYSETLILTTNDGSIQINLMGTGMLVTSLEDDILDEEEVRVYPNPATQKLVVDLSMSKVVRYDLQLMDIKGRVKWYSGELTQRQLEIAVADYQPGLYLLKVNSNQGQVVKKVFVVSR